MDDRFLSAARRPPRPEFAAALRDRLAAADASSRARSFERSRAVRRGLFTLAPVAAAIVALVAFPEVRAGAQSFLELFRVRHFVAVNFDPARLKVLQDRAVDPLTLVGDVRETGHREEPRAYPDPASAFAAAGYAGREPATLPAGLAVDSVVVLGAGSAEVRLEASKLNELLASLGIHDATLPPALDGSTISVQTARSVAVRYRGGNFRALLVQAPHPQIGLPPGLERARLAEIGLRVLGLEAAEARRFADRIDWNSTALIPVPTGECTFREVEVGGRQALLIEAEGDGEKGRARADRRVLLWSDADRIFALSGNLRDYDLLHMASSVR